VEYLVGLSKTQMIYKKLLNSAHSALTVTSNKYSSHDTPEAILCLGGGTCKKQNTKILLVYAHFL